MGALHAMSRYLTVKRERPRATPAIDMALAASDDLIERMRSSTMSGDPVRGIMSNLWEQRHNVPYLTTMYEANAEMTAAIETAKRKKT